MRFFAQDRMTVRNIIVLIVLTAIVLFVIGSVVMAFLFPIVTTDYEFLKVPTLTPPSP